MTIKEWQYSKTDPNEKSIIKRLLSARGINSEEEIKEFTNPLEMQLTKPEVFCDMQKSVERITEAIENDEKIIIYGDFDADGVTSTSLLIKTFRHIGANVDFYIPNRDTEGHGLNSKALVKIMTNHKPKLLITVDCGISNIEEIYFLKSFKIDCIITDHHEAPEKLPEALAIINPKSPNALDEKLTAKEIKSLTSLAGVGVAFKLAQALLNYYNKLDYIPEILPFVAVGTVADVVPLIGENRYFVTKGLELISNGKHYGLSRLLASAKLGEGKPLNSETVAFGIAPRINASGRLDTVESAVKLLISDNHSEIELAIQTLNDLNAARQTITQETFEQADDMLKKEGNKNPAIILFNKEWQVGIVGIVASKLVEKYYKPTFLMTYSEETNQIKCSARGIEGVHLYECISEIGEILDGFGGHALAAGLVFSPEKHSFNEVKDALNKVIKEAIGGRVLKPFINIDMELTPDEITVDLPDELVKLEPYGASNPTPIFSISDCILKQKIILKEKHLKLIIEKDGKEFTCLKWNCPEISLDTNCSIDIAFSPELNEFNGNTSVQLMIKDIHSPDLHDEEAEQISTIKIYDHRKKTDILPQVNDYVKNSKLDIKIFAEKKQIRDELSKYKDLSQNTVSRNNITNCDAIMFFDYPADKETFESIIRTASPKAIHFMNYDIQYYDEKDFLKNIAGMIKFACNNNGGKIDLIRCASFLGKSVNMIKLFLDLAEENGILNISEKNNEYYIVTNFSAENMPNMLKSPKYNDIAGIAEECEYYQKSLLEDDISDIDNMCNMII
ncbi:single-stranded-DNA-specific exonuclease RecJ [bacterium]|nr:single-stranded-DNA-specific exonuclease RecJ [bacterium]